MSAKWEIRGKISELPRIVETGSGARFVELVVTFKKYQGEGELCFTAWRDNIERTQSLAVGTEILASGSMSSRVNDHQGKKYYTPQLILNNLEVFHIAEQSVVEERFQEPKNEPEPMREIPF